MMVLSYLSVAMPFLVMFGLGLLIPSLIVLGYSNFLAGLIIIATTFLLEVISMGGAGLRLGLNLFLTDIGLILIGMVAVLRLLFAKDFPRRNRAWLLFAVIVALYLAAGLIKHGTAAGVQARPYFYFVVTGLYGMSFPIDGRRVRQTMNVMAVVGAVLAVITIYRWIVYYLPIYSLLPYGGTYNADTPIRVIKANETLILIEMLIGGLFFARLTKGFRSIQMLSPIWLALVIVLQHRSVWLAGLVGVLSQFMLLRYQKAINVSWGILMAIIVSISAMPLFFSERLVGVAEQVQSSAVRAVTGADTTSARLHNWQATISKWYEGGPASILFGQGIGADTTRYVEKSGEIGVEKVTYYAHNLYVQALYNFGLLGFVALVAAFFYVIVRLFRMYYAGIGGSETQLLIVLMMMQIAYYIPYGTDYMQSLIFGVAMSYVALHSTRKAGVTDRDGGKDDTSQSPERLRYTPG